MGMIVSFCYVLVSPAVLLVLGIAQLFSDRLAPKDK